MLSLQVLCARVCMRERKEDLISLPSSIQLFVKRVAVRKWLLVGFDGNKNQVDDVENALRVCAKKEEEVEIDLVSLNLSRDDVEVPPEIVKNLSTSMYDAVFCYSWISQNVPRSWLRLFAIHVKSGGGVCIAGEALAMSSDTSSLSFEMEVYSPIEEHCSGSASNAVIRKGKGNDPLHSALFRNVKTFEMCLAMEAFAPVRGAISLGECHVDPGSTRPAAIVLERRASSGCVICLNLYPWSTHTGGVGWQEKSTGGQFLYNAMVMCDRMTTWKNLL